MRISPKAQASIEYMTIIVLVVTGIVLMGPYVIRSINAHFKSIDDQVQDSFQEKITQAPLPPDPIPICNCPTWVDQDCGALGRGTNCTDADPSTLCCDSVGDPDTFKMYSKKPCIPEGC